MRQLLPLPLLLALQLGWAALPAGPNWQQLEKGLEFARWRVAGYDSATGKGFCRMGEPYVAALRVDPAWFRFKVSHYSMLDSPAQPLTVRQWQEQLKAVAVFNAGQYYPDLTYMGLLISGDQHPGKRLHPNWQALFVAEPTRPGNARAKIIDLRYDQFQLSATPYTQVVQSFMLFDRHARKRVKQGDWVANRTAVAVDRKGRVLIFVSEGGFTLWDFARLLQTSRLDLVQGLSMDGGYESELAVKTSRLSYTSYGQWETNDYGDISIPGVQMPLPAVVALFRRE